MSEEEKINSIVEMGFPRARAIEALKKFKYDKEEALNYILLNPVEGDDEMEKASNSYIVAASMMGPAPASGYLREDDDMQTVLMASLQDNAFGYDLSSMQPREEGVPVGIKNVGNTCYFNSLLQSYFMVPKFVKEILSFRAHPALLEENKGEVEEVRRKASINLVLQMQKLFAGLIRSQKKSLDPSKMLSALVDEYGNPIPIGDQKDVGEFNMVLLARVEEGLKAHSVERRPSGGDIAIHLLDSPLTPEELTEGGIVSNLFYGTQQELLHAVNEKGEDVRVEGKAIFGQIIVQVEDKDLYSAWDTSHFSVISDYQVSDNFSTSANQEIWIETTPDMLLFQIQRVKYDKANATSEKIHDPFTFPKMLYPGRFMKKHKDINCELRMRMLELKKRAAMLEEGIRKFKRFQGMNISLDKMLEETAGFLEHQSNDAMDIEETDLRIFDPYTNGLNTNELPGLISVIREYAETTRIKLEDMEQQLADHKAEIDAIFDLPELKETPYHLHSILIHDGHVGSGHYYAYIFDPQQEIWRKYNDTHITVVSEDQVMNEAIGGNGTCSAYCLVYISQSLLPSPNSAPLRLYSTETSDEYTNFIPSDLLNEIEEENKKFKDDIVEQKIGGSVKRIQDLFNHRIMLCNTQHNSKSSNFARDYKLKHELINFGIFLKLEREDQLNKWYLLDLSVRECENKSLENLEENDPVYVRLSTQFKKNCKDAPSDFTLSDTNRSRLDRKLKEFHENYCTSSITLYMVGHLLENRFEPCAYALLLQATSQTNNSREFVKFFEEVSIGFLLRLTGEMVLLACNNQIRMAANWGWFVVRACSSLFHRGSYVIKLVKERLFRIKIGIAENLPQFYSPDVEKEMSDIIAGIDSQQFRIFPDEQQMPRDLETLKERLDGFNAYEWSEGWQHHSLAVRFIDLKKQLEASEFYKWIELGNKTKRGFATLNDFNAVDRMLGIPWNI